MNKVILTGRLVKDPELRYTQSNMAVCTFNLAVDRGLSKQKKQEAESQNRPTADFPRITSWGLQAENASKYLSKGSQCIIDGRLQTGSYKDNNGNNIFTTDVIADRIEFIYSQNEQKQGQNETNYKNRSNYTSNQNNSNYGANNDDFFDDDFSEIEDDGRIPF